MVIVVTPLLIRPVVSLGCPEAERIRKAGFHILETLVFPVELEQLFVGGQMRMSGNALLEVYTCYPVVPMGFLLAAEMIASVEQMPAFLERYEVTVTGGMNLAGAPWNNPALHALIAMYKKMKSSPHRYGAVHGNGGLGFGQGVAILGKVEL